MSGDNDLAANLVPDALFAAKLHHGRRAGDAQLRLQRSWFVVDAGMNDGAVVAALMPAHAIFLFQQQQAEPGKAPRDLQRDGKANNASTHDDDVVAVFDRLGKRRKTASGELECDSHSSTTVPVCERLAAHAGHCTVSVTDEPLGWLTLAGEPTTVIV